MELRFAQSNRMPANPRMIVGQGALQYVRRERAEAVESAKRVQPAHRSAIVRNQLFQERHGRAILAVDQQLLHRIALPAIGAVEGSDESGGVELIEPGNRPRRSAFWIYAVDSSLIFAGPHIEALQPLTRNPLWVFDHLPVHIGD